MSWTQFLTATSVLYILYYGLNFLFDLLRSEKGTFDGNDEETLFFSDEFEPEIIDLSVEDIPVPNPTEENGPEKEDPELTSRPAIGAVPESTGAVSLKQLFELAKNESIEYTAAIPY